MLHVRDGCGRGAGEVLGIFLLWTEIGEDVHELHTISKSIPQAVGGEIITKE